MGERRRSGIPWGLVATIGLVLGLERGRPRDELSNSTGTSISWRHGARAARDRARGCDILCFGDSLVQFDVQARVIEERTGKRAYNLSLFSGPTMASYYQLRHALESGARPSRLIVDFQPATLRMGPGGGFKRLWPELLSTREALDLARTAGAPALLTEITLGHLSPTIRDRYEIRANVMAALRGESYFRSMLVEVAPFWRNWKANRGSAVLPGSHRVLASLTPAEEEAAARPEMFDETAAAYLLRFLDLAASRRIPVYWVLLPNHPLIQARRDASGQEECLTCFARSLQVRYPDLNVIDARRCGFPGEAFFDICHLDVRGAYAVSLGISDVLRRSYAGREPAARWSELPPFRDAAAGPDLEDIDQSRIAMKVAL